MKHYIMIKLLYLVLPFLFLISCSTSTEPDITYVISKTFTKEIPQLKIKLTCPAEANGKTFLAFQNKAWGANSLHRVITSMKLLNHEGTIVSNGDDRFVVSHPKDAKSLEIEYVLQQDHKDPLTTRNDFRPVIQTTYFHVYAHNLLVFPSAIQPKEEDRFTANIVWEGFSEEDQIINSFGSNSRNQLLENMTEGDFHSAIFVGGDYRTKELEVNGNRVVLGIRGEWESISEDELAQVLKHTIAAQRNLWQDHSQPYFLVTMTPANDKKGSSLHGTGLTNSFALVADNNEFLEMKRLTSLMNHELQHNWTGKTILNANEEEQYWFSEGFTEYYTFKNIAVNKINGLEKEFFMESLNSTISKLSKSPVQTAPNSDITYDNFWSSFEYSKLPYRRGAVFAFYLDQLIYQDSNGVKSLDDLLLQIKKDALANGQRIDHDYFVKTANTYLDQDLSTFFNNHIVEGKAYDLAEIFTLLNFDFEPISLVFDLGFQFEEDQMTIKMVDPESKAHHAGLRAGDQLVSRSIYYGDMTKEVEFTSLRNEVKTEISYFPIREAAIPKLTNTHKNFENLSF